jgi:SagB-type dehydrogenase family enzyme
MQAALDYHDSTKHSDWSVRQSGHVLDWENQPIPFKIYQDLEPLPLPQDFAPLTVPALEALSGSEPPTAPELTRERVPDLPTVARVLHLSAGITKVKRYPGGETYFRAYPNTGALYHIDLYLVCGDLPGLGAGVYHFGPHDFSLRRLREGDLRGNLVESAGGEPRISEAPVLLVSTSTYWRNAWKYRARTYRHCFWDSGTLHANLLAVAGAEDLGPRVVLGFIDATVERLLGLDSAREAALTLVALGCVGSAPPTPREVPELRLETAPLSRSEVDYPEIPAIHAASSLATADEAMQWRTRAPVPSTKPEEGELFPTALPEASALSTHSLQDVILRRGSTRRFDPEKGLTLSELATVLDRASAPIPADFLAPHGATLVDLYLIVHSVEGLAPGAYFYRREKRALELLRRGEFRGQAGRLGLFQELPAHAAVNVYSLADPEPVLERYGNRGYRAAQLEGGIRGGRMYLSAYAQRFGATGLTFLDDEVTEFFSPHAAGKGVLFLTALGRSVRRGSPSKIA